MWFNWFFFKANSKHFKEISTKFDFQNSNTAKTKLILADNNMHKTIIYRRSEEERREALCVQTLP